MSVKDYYIQNVTNQLITDGSNLIKECRSNANFTNRTNNLEDSYGSCVYYNGKEVFGSRRYVGHNAHEGKKWYGETLYGKTEIDKFFTEYKPVMKGWELVLAVAMPYGEILEEKYKYRVIAMSYDYLSRIAPKYGSLAFIRPV